tara:strand:+ start:49562 stop:49846 length:285 start_codon:yes stop_codon:yes gene_type:complete
MDTILLHGITIEELKAVISDVVRTELERSLNQSKESQNYNVEQAAKLLLCSKLTVYNYIKKGFLPASKIGRNYIIKKADMDNALKEVKSLKYRR